MPLEWKRICADTKESSGWLQAHHFAVNAGRGSACYFCCTAGSRKSESNRRIRRSLCGDYDEPAFLWYGTGTTAWRKAKPICNGRIWRPCWKMYVWKRRISGTEGDLYSGIVCRFAENKSYEADRWVWNWQIFFRRGKKDYNWSFAFKQRVEIWNDKKKIKHRSIFKIQQLKLQCKERGRDGRRESPWYRESKICKYVLDLWVF